jgi:hypothetical protein
MSKLELLQKRFSIFVEEICAFNINVPGFWWSSFYILSCLNTPPRCEQAFQNNTWTCEFLLLHWLTVFGAFNDASIMSNTTNTFFKFTNPYFPEWNHVACIPLGAKAYFFNFIKNHFLFFQSVKCACQLISDFFNLKLLNRSKIKSHQITQCHFISICQFV